MTWLSNLKIGSIAAKIFRTNNSVSLNRSLSKPQREVNATKSIMTMIKCPWCIMEISIIISLIAVIVVVVSMSINNKENYRHQLKMMELDYQAKIAHLEYQVLHAKLNSLNDLLGKEKTDETEQTSGSNQQGQRP